MIGQRAVNIASGLMGGLPIISEIVRSSAIIALGAVSKWSNFFHGFFLLLVMLFLIPIIEWIPNAALAALLIYAGYNLASFKHFIHVYSIGKGQFFIFLTIIFFTLFEDLLVGVAAGMLVKIGIEFYLGLKLKYIFKTSFLIKEFPNETVVHLQEAAIFSHRNTLKKILNSNIEFYR
ncbi:hypothetical protein JCM31826_20150 [Thermaurantimonas aggregans]|uniref:SLC26A/SulP transporter domain-containing protein n=1 Tax=Thermaurantimonas aggregans TaxID=2173829 RepID=A0A401XNJ1_9FLAO|nr:hypothetical protein JCM31826_20150 [Thermaurantimonas aggregans]